VLAFLRGSRAQKKKADGGVQRGAFLVVRKISGKDGGSCAKHRTESLCASIYRSGGGGRTHKTREKCR